MNINITKIKNKKKASARGNIRYALGYQLGSKAIDQNRAYHAIIEASLLRSDLGVGVAWTPPGDGIRPSKVYAQGVSSFAGGDIEIQMMCDGNKHTKAPTQHDIISFNEAESRYLTDDEAIHLARAYYINLFGFEVASRLSMYLSVHRDTILPDGQIGPDGTGNLHVHSAWGRMDPLTSKAISMTKINSRASMALRQTELDNGLQHDNGLYVVDETQASRIRPATKEEKARWAREKNGQEQAQRLSRLERKNHENVEELDRKFTRYCNAQIEPAIRRVIAKADEHKEEALVVQFHNAAASLGARLAVLTDEDGYTTIYLRKVSTISFRREQDRALVEFETALEARHDLSRDERRDTLRDFMREQKLALAVEQANLAETGELVPVSRRLSEDLGVVDGVVIGNADRHRALCDVSFAEEMVVDAIARDSSFIARGICESESVFDREDYDRAVSALISNAGAAEEAAALGFQQDPNIVMLSPDVADGIYTTREIQAIEEQFAIDLRAMARSKVAKYSPAILAEVMAEVQAEEQAEQLEKWTTKNTPIEKRVPFVWSKEQTEALRPIGEGAQVVMIVGLPGVGKTSLMKVVKRYNDRLVMPTRGCTVAASAAERLEQEAGFPALNSALTLINEANGDKHLHENSGLVVDEVGMMDSRLTGGLTGIARARGIQMILIGDPTQLPPIGAGNPARTAIDICGKAGTLRYLREIWRQENAWHQDAVVMMADAIEARDKAKIKASIQVYADKGCFTWFSSQKETVDAGAAWYCEQMSANAGETSIIASPTRETTRHLCEAIQKRLGYGHGVDFETEKLGTVHLSVGERFIFLKNRSSKKDPSQRVLNGDTGTIVAMPVMVDGILKGKEIFVKLDKDGRIVTIDPEKYQNFGLGYAYTDHTTQGATVDHFLQIAGRSTTAEMHHVAMSRAKKTVGVYGSRQSIPGETEGYAEIVAANITAKGSTFDITERVNSRGGKDTILARNRRAGEAQSESGAAYEAAMAERKRVCDAELKALNDEMRRRLIAAGLDEAARKVVKADHRRETQAVMEMHGPEDRVSFVQRRDRELAAQDDVLDEIREIRARKETDLTAERSTPDVAKAPARTPNASDKARQPDKERIERERVAAAKKDKGRSRGKDLDYGR